MTYYHPCKNCAADRATCSRRAEVAKVIAGASITSVKFRCADRKPMFYPGQRVSLSWRHYEPNDWGDSDELKMTFTGTVLMETRLRFIVRVDEGECQSSEDEKMEAKHVFRSDRLVIKVKPSDMTALDEPDRAICQSCAAYEGEGDRCHGYGRPNSWEGYWPDGCLNKFDAPQ